MPLVCGFLQFCRANALPAQNSDFQVSQATAVKKLLSSSKTSVIQPCFAENGTRLFRSRNTQNFGRCFQAKKLKFNCTLFPVEFFESLELKRHFVFSQNKKAPAAKTSERFLYQKNHFQLTMANTAKTIISSLMAASKAFDTTFGCARTPFHRS